MIAVNLLDSLSLKDLTLVVPTFNRHAHLSRLLNYYKSVGAGFDILVLDSSEQSVVDSNARLIAQLGNNFSHKTFSSALPVAGKLLQGITGVRTQYCAFCADDDIVFIDGLVQALDYLRKTPDCVCVDGIYLNFHRVGNDVQVHIEYASYGIDSIHPCARVFRLFQRYESLFYGVFRTADLQDIFTGVSSIQTLHFQELFQSVSALLIGKSHRLPVFYAGRQCCDPAEPTRDKWQTYYWFAENRAEFIDHYVVYRSVLSDFYHKHGEPPLLDDDAFIKAMDLAHATFFGVGCPPLYFFDVLHELWPNDSFRDNSKSPDICDLLQSNIRNLWVRGLMKFSRLVRKWCLKIAFRGGSLAIKGGSGVSLNCVLPDNLRWFSGSAEFRVAYKELCAYLDASD